MLGLKRGTVQLKKHNPKWIESFEIEAKKLSNIFGKDALDIQHVGSTAIPTIPAKPVIDIGVIVPSFQEVRKCEKKLNKLGYQLKKNDAREDRLFFTKGPEDARTHYLHIGEAGSGYIEDMILFRDYILTHADAAKQYTELKQILSHQHSDKRDIYTARKTTFINEILNKTKSSV